MQMFRVCYFICDKPKKHSGKLSPPPIREVLGEFLSVRQGRDIWISGPLDLPESWPRRLHTLVLSRFRLIRLNWSSKWLRGMS